MSRRPTKSKNATAAKAPADKVVAELERLIAYAADRERVGDAAMAAASYRRIIALRPDFAGAHNNLGTALRALGEIEKAIDAYRQALALKPDYPLALSNLGSVLREHGQLDEAVAACLQAVNLQADYAEAYSNLGAALQEQGKNEEAVAICAHAIRLQPGLAEAFCNMGNALLDSGRIDEAEAAYRNAIALKPDYPEPHRNLGSALRCNGRLDEAERAFRQAILHRPDYADAHFDIALLHLLKGDFATGWREYEWRWRTRQLVARSFAEPRWDGGDLGGRTLLVHAEQGFGDTLHFARYLPLLAGRGGRVVFEVQRPLVRLMSGLSGVDRVVAGGDPLPAFDAQIPLLSLPLALGTRLATIPARIPYLGAEAGAVAAWRERLGPGLKVGLVWAGGPRPHDPAANRIDRRRSMRLMDFAPLAGIPGVTFVSLQKDGPAALEAAAPPEGLALAEVMEGIGDFADTAALISALDLVISVDTAVAHLAGALGRPVWILSRFDGCWRWLLDRDDSPWYPTARLYRQKKPGDWAEVVARIAADLARWVLTAPK